MSSRSCNKRCHAVFLKYARLLIEPYYVTAFKGARIKRAKIVQMVWCIFISFALSESSSIMSDRYQLDTMVPNGFHWTVLTFFCISWRVSLLITLNTSDEPLSMFVWLKPSDCRARRLLSIPINETKIYQTPENILTGATSIWRHFKQDLAANQASDKNWKGTALVLRITMKLEVEEIASGKGCLRKMTFFVATPVSSWRSDQLWYQAAVGNAFLLDFHLIGRDKKQVITDKIRHFDLNSN